MNQVSSVHHPSIQPTTSNTIIDIIHKRRPRSPKASDPITSSTMKQKAPVLNQTLVQTYQIRTIQTRPLRRQRVTPGMTTQMCSGYNTSSGTRPRPDERAQMQLLPSAPPTRKSISQPSRVQIVKVPPCCGSCKPGPRHRDYEAEAM